MQMAAETGACGTKGLDENTNVPFPFWIFVRIVVFSPKLK